MLLSLQLGLPPLFRLPPRPLTFRVLHLDPPRVRPLIGGSVYFYEAASFHFKVSRRVSLLRLLRLSPYLQGRVPVILIITGRSSLY